MARQILSIGLGSAVIKGAKLYKQNVEHDEDRQVARDTANAKKELMDEKLRQMGLQKDANLFEQQLQQSIAAGKAANNKIMKMESYNFFDAYAIDDDPKHLNNAIQSIPALKGVIEMGFGGEIAKIQRLDMTNQQDLNLLRQEEGIDPSAPYKPPKEGKGESLNLDNIRARYLKVIGKDGTERIIDVADDLYASTGYFNHKSKQAQDEIISKMTIASKAKKLSGTGTPGEIEKTARFIAEQTKNSDDPITVEQAARGLYLDRIQGNVAGQITASDRAEGELLAAAGIDPKDKEAFGKFKDLDVTSPEMEQKLHSKVVALERLSKENMSDRQKKDFETIAAGISSAKSATDLEEPSTGLLDVPLDSMSQYIENEMGADEVAQKQARNAYYSLRNVIRHTISGASLTEAEIKAFNDAYGTLKQKLPAVLSGLVVQLRQTRGKIAAMSKTLHPLAAHYRIGGTRQNLDTLIEHLDTRLEGLGSEGTAVKEFFEGGQGAEQ